MKFWVIRRKKGATAVLLLFILSALASMLALFIGQSKERLVEGSTESLGRLWASAVLGEYDRNLWEQYGLFGFDAVESPPDRTLERYVSFSFDEKEYVRSREVTPDLSGYELTDIGIFKKQVTQAEVIKCGAGNDGKLRERYGDESISKKEITNRRFISSLPSRGQTDEGLLARAKAFIHHFSSVKEGISFAADNWESIAYIEDHFDTMVQTKSDREPYLAYEQEYLIAGKLSDEENYKSVRSRIIALREVMNLITIHNDPEKKALALAAAEVIATPAFAPAAQEGILALWAFAESVNDYKLLIHGKKVPLQKTAEAWATDLDAVLHSTSDGYIDTESEEGDDYAAYLKMLLYLTDPSVRYARMMDLIEIDMINRFDGGFRLEAYFTGLRYLLEVNGKSYTFEDAYSAA